VAAAVPHVILGALHVVCGARGGGGGGQQRHTWSGSATSGQPLCAEPAMLAQAGPGLRLRLWRRCGSHASAARPPCRSQKAISGSIIQNSARWRAVWEFSARKVGPGRKRGGGGAGGRWGERGCLWGTGYRLGVPLGWAC
jgi:hypothetical protein